MLRTFASDILHWYSANAVTVFGVASVTAFAGEMIYRKRRRNLDLRESTTSLASAAGFLLAKNALSKLVMVSLSLYIYTEHRLFTLDLSNLWIWAGVFLLRDFVYYWVHRSEHKLKVLWASHMIHHSPETIGFATAIRVPWMEAIYKPWIGLWVPLLGFNPVAFIVLDVLAATIGQLQHTTACRKRTVLDSVFVTPSAHRVHHASNTEYLDKNFGAVFILWDRLFGTYTPETRQVVYGLKGGKQIDSATEALVGGFPDLIAAARRQPTPMAKARFLLSPL
jgi:sterol desaturase/sphingolipid hydroxylase (fatty acid hydroxylase superfamily)